MQSTQISKTVFLIAISVFLLWGCGDKKETANAPVVSKRISVQTEKKSAIQESVEQPKTTSPSGESEKDAPESALAERIYDPKERINPFLPLFRSENKDIVPEQNPKAKRKKRVPQTPLEKISLEQLKLVAIIRAASGNRALVEDSSGKGFVVKKGTYIGLNSGIITQINADLVIIEEELENLMGELVLQNTEIKLQKPAGE